jgi:hypothetical protein
MNKGQVYHEQLTLDRVPSSSNKDAPDTVRSADKKSDSEEQSALFKELDKAGPYARQMNGALETEAFMVMRMVINKHVMLEFKEKKEELMEKRLAAYKEKNEQEYVRNITEAT